MPNSKKRVGKSEAIKVKKYYDVTFSSEEGEKVLLDLMTIAGIMGPSLDLNRPDPYVMAFNEGAKSVFYRIIAMLEETPEKYLHKVRNRIQEDEDEFKVE